MCVAWLAEIKRGPSGLPPTKGAPDGPPAPYPKPRPNGRGDHHPLLPHRRCLRAAQSPRPSLRVPQATLRLRGHHACPLPTASWGGERTFLLAGRRAVLLAPVPRGRRARPFLAAPPHPQAQALLGALASGGGGRAGR